MSPRVRIVHLADLHLGFRQFQRLTPAGINQREADVALVFREAMDRVIALRPDAVILAGDIFHTVRPSNPAILHAFRQLSRLRAALPDAVVCMVAGNHDAPKTTETGCILRLFSDLGVLVADGEPRRFEIPERDLAILAVPDTPAAQGIRLEPESHARYNILVLHGEIAGVLPRGAQPGDRAATEFPVEALHAPKWSYVALGHYHVYRKITENAYYSGSLDYTSTNSWGERAEEREIGIPGKGFVERDLESGAHRFHPVPPPRALVDLAEIQGREMSAAELDELIRSRVDACPGGIDDKIVRLIVRDVPRHITRDLDPRAQREYKRRALHFQLDARRPEPVRLQGLGAPSRRLSLAEMLESQLRARSLTSDVDRDALVALGARYLREAELLPVSRSSALVPDSE